MMANHWTRGVKIVFGLAASSIALFLGAALLGSLLPVNQQWQQPDDGIRLFIETNGVHTGLILPIRTDVHDFSDLVRPEHLDEPGRYGSHILVGWGDAEFYRTTPRWADVRPGTVINAAVGSGETLLHIEHRTYPQAYPHYRRPFRVSETEYANLAEHIRAHFRLDANGRVSTEAGYSPNDLFYASTGRYSALRTCNEWVRDALETAGVRVGRWSPFQGGVMRWFQEPG